MEVELFLVCDSISSEKSGRLNIRGIHNSRVLASFPAETDGFTIVARLRFGPEEMGPHQIAVAVYDPDEHLCGAPAVQDFEIQHIPGAGPPYAWISPTVSITEFRFEKEGIYRPRLLLDGHLVATCILSAVQWAEETPLQDS